MQPFFLLTLCLPTLITSHPTPPSDIDRDSMSLRRGLDLLLPRKATCIGVPCPTHQDGTPNAAACPAPCDICLTRNGKVTCDQSKPPSPSPNGGGGGTGVNGGSGTQQGQDHGTCPDGTAYGFGGQEDCFGHNQAGNHFNPVLYGTSMLSGDPGGKVRRWVDGLWGKGKGE